MLGTCWECESLMYSDERGFCPECGAPVDVDNSFATHNDLEEDPDIFGFLTGGEAE